ncbi:hypothetical protein SAMN05660349_00963 [Macellibacteroides fermentans]|uniref:Uncharacterized protein n=1 Tax=Parabacteroides chartae TaxID=1037355 RepID=A0A1T5AZZ5_9BACT|nr:hypothetical protein SAMN05660349_00963 [Parabacteroides chartae]
MVLQPPLKRVFVKNICHLSFLCSKPCMGADFGNDRWCVTDLFHLSSVIPGRKRLGGVSKILSCMVRQTVIRPLSTSVSTTLILSGSFKRFSFLNQRFFLKDLMVFITMISR